MTDSIHGHEVLDLVLSAREPLTLQALEAQVNARFGPDARFHTCSASGLTCPELLELLGLKGKLVATERGIQADRSQICEH